MRTDYPMWGKAPRAARRNRPHARRLPKGRKPTRPGEIIQLDTLSLTLAGGRPPSSCSPPATPSPSGHVPKPAATPPHTTPNASSTGSSTTCPSPSRPLRSMAAPGSKPTASANAANAASTSSNSPATPRTQRPRRAQQRRLVLRVLRNMGPARRQPRRHQPVGRCLHRRVQHLPTAPGTRRTYPRRVPSSPCSRRDPPASHIY